MTGEGPPVADGFQVRRARDSAQLLAITAPLEPHSTVITGPLMTRGLSRRDRARLVTQADGSVAGVVLLTRVCRDRWYAKPLLLDERAAPLLARIIERSRARGILGPEEHVGPVAAHVQRAGRQHSVPWAWVPPPMPGPDVPLDPRTRIATRADLDALVALYRDFRLDPIPRTQLRGVLTRILDDGMVVVGVEGGELVAGMRAEVRSVRYLYWGGLTVRSDVRNQGLARAVIMRTHAVTAACGLGYVVVRATGRMPRREQGPEFNPLLLRRNYRELGRSGTWLTVKLRPRLKELLRPSAGEQARPPAGAGAV